MPDKPQWKHDCTKCRFLGQTIGGKRLVDLYVCESVLENDATLIARYSDEDSDYAACPSTSMAHPNGHAELFAAKALYEESLNVPEVAT